MSTHSQHSTLEPSSQPAEKVTPLQLGLVITASVAIWLIGDWAEKPLNAVLGWKSTPAQAGHEITKCKSNFRGIGPDLLVFSGDSPLVARATFPVPETDGEPLIRCSSPVCVRSQESMGKGGKISR